MTPMLGIMASQISGHLATVFDASDYESIFTTTLGSNQTTITFSSIPQTYKHLQLRILARTTRTAGTDLISIRMNSDSSSIYSDHFLIGDGTAPGIDRDVSATKINIQRVASDNLSANIFSAFVIDILDYTNTNKYKTTRSLGGFDSNGDGRIVLGSGLYMSTSAISTLALQGIEYGTDYKTYSQFALYGVKG
jgi:hypothetical protein